MVDANATPFFNLPDPSIQSSYLVRFGEALGSQGQFYKRDLSDAELNDFQFQIYPNPNNGSFNVKWPVMDNTIEIKIFNPLGQPVYQVEANGKLMNTSISLEHVATGVYFMQLTFDNQTNTVRLIKQ